MASQKTATFTTADLVHDFEATNSEVEMTDDHVRQTSGNEGFISTPMASLYQITGLRSLHSTQAPVMTNKANVPVQRPRDLISRGLLDWSDADRLVQLYLRKSDYYLYGIASKYQNTESIRNASSLLLVSICTVSALQDPSSQPLYRTCHAELRKLVFNFVFTPQVDLEDFRGLCIACFWLSDLSWSLSGLAIRRAVEFELQKSTNLLVDICNHSESFISGMSTDRTRAIERVRLWYLFYICDQHLSILYARPSTIHEYDSVSECEQYLAAVQNTNTDMRIVSQVALLRILSNVTKLFGQNLDARIPTIFISQIDEFNRQLDQWATTWLNKCGGSPNRYSFINGS